MVHVKHFGSPYICCMQQTHDRYVRYLVDDHALGASNAVTACGCYRTGLVSILTASS